MNEPDRLTECLCSTVENLSKIGSALATALIERYLNLWIGLDCAREGRNNIQQNRTELFLSSCSKRRHRSTRGPKLRTSFTKTGKLDPLLRRPVGELITGPCPRPAGPRTWPLETRIVHGSRPPGHLHEPCPCPHSGRASLCAPACAACRPWNRRPRHLPLSSMSAPLLCRLAPFPQTVSRIITITYHITPAPPSLQK